MAWKKNTPFVDAVRKMRELAVRAQRIELTTRIARAKVMVAALVPPSTEKPRG